MSDTRERRRALLARLVEAQERAVSASRRALRDVERCTELRLDAVEQGIELPCPRRRSWSGGGWKARVVQAGKES